MLTIKMASLKLLTLFCIASTLAESKWHQHKREIRSTICDPVQNNTNKVQCFCGRFSENPMEIANADCYQTVKNVSQDDLSWEGFSILQNATKLTLTNTRGVPMNYVPTNALKYTKVLLRLDVKYCNIERIDPFAFANLSLVKEITLRDNQIQVLAVNAFANHPSLKTLSLDQNNISELNRDVFVNLPALEQLFLTGNKITTIHDRAFVHLTNLKELEIDKNNIFSLNSETFAGLKNLEKLELSGNSIEVIGDNTFLPLTNLRFLNLGENKIQMLDEKAFNGLYKLQFLALPSNKISAIENVNVFKPLTSLSTLSLKANDIRVISPEAFAPIIDKFYSTAAQLILEGNHFPCDCNLDVFKPILNKTLNERLKLEIQNVQCYPSEEIKQKWDKFQEIEKSTGQVFEDEELQENGAYEYYDETELNGTLFYFDMRHLLNCSGDEPATPVHSIQTKPIADNNLGTPTQTSISNTKVTSSPNINLIPSVPKPDKSSTNNKGTLDLFTEESTTMTTNEESKVKTASDSSKSDNQNIKSVDIEERGKGKKENIYTTSRLATVSAKPLDHKSYDDREMASDEAKPDRIKAHRSVQQDMTKSNKFSSNNANKNLTCGAKIMLIVLSFRLFS